MTNDANIGQTGGAPIQGPMPLQPLEFEYSSGTQQSSGVSSIEQSKSESVPYIPDSSNPLLAFPEDFNSIVQFSAALSAPKGIDIQTFFNLMRLRIDETITSMMDKWVENIRENERQIQEYLQSWMYQVRLELKNPEKIEAESEKIKVLSLNESANNYLQGNENSSINPAAAIAMGTIFLGDIIGVASIAQSASINAIVEASTQIAATVPHAMAAELGMLGTVMISPFLYYASFSTAMGVSSENKPSSLDYSRNFAREVLQLGADSEYIRQQVVDKLSNASSLTEERKQQLVSIVKLIIGVVALASILKAEAPNQQISLQTLEEIKNMLLGYRDVADDWDIKKSLIIMVKLQLSQLDPEESSKILEGIFKYLGENPDMEDLTNPGKAFESIFYTTLYTDHTGNSQPA